MVLNHLGLKFHHFGLAVRTPATAFRYLKALGYREGTPVYDPLQRVNLAMCYHADMPDVEVIWPGDEPSPIDKLIKRSGSMIYHLCYTTDDPEAALEAMAAAGLDVLPVSQPEPAVLFGGRPVSFYVVADVGLIELIHGDPGESPGQATAGAMDKVMAR